MQFNDLFIYNLLNSKIDCPEILGGLNISLNVPNFTLRSTLTFYMFLHTNVIMVFSHP